MKRYIAITVFALFACLGMASCQQENISPTDDTTSQSLETVDPVKESDDRD